MFPPRPAFGPSVAPALLSWSNEGCRGNEKGRGKTNKGRGNREIGPALLFRKGRTMLWTIAVLLLLLWAAGMVSSYTLGGFIHILLILAVIAVVIRLIQGRRPL